MTSTAGVMPVKPAASQRSTLRSISQVAQVWRSQCGVTFGRPASFAMALKPLLTLPVIAKPPWWMAAGRLLRDEVGGDVAAASGDQLAPRMKEQS